SRPAAARTSSSETVAAEGTRLAYDCEQRVDHVRVEVRPAAPHELRLRLLERQRLPVRPVGRHRVEGVAAADDARAERDVLAGEPVRIAAAVPSLVAGPD